MNLRLLLVASIIIFTCQPTFASLNDLESAIITQDFQAAKQTAVDLLKGDLKRGESAQVKFYLALSHLMLEEFEPAKVIFKEIIDEPLEEQLRDRAYLGLFNVYYLNEDYKEALKIVNKVYELSPNSTFLSMIYLKMARVNLKLTNWRKARTYLKKVIDDFPNSVEVHAAKQLLQERQYFAVQVGAFLERKFAEKQVEDLRRKNEYAYIVETMDKDNVTFYRVRVGQMTLLDDARELKNRLAQEGYPTQIYP